MPLSKDSMISYIGPDTNSTDGTSSDGINYTLYISRNSEELRDKMNEMLLEGSGQSYFKLLDEQHRELVISTVARVFEDLNDNVIDLESKFPWSPIEAFEKYKLGGNAKENTDIFAMWLVECYARTMRAIISVNDLYLGFDDLIEDFGGAFGNQDNFMENALQIRMK